MQPSLRPARIANQPHCAGRERTIAFMGERRAPADAVHDPRHRAYLPRALFWNTPVRGKTRSGWRSRSHLAPTLMGMTVEIATRITSVEGRKVSFEVTVKDELDTVGTGNHMRFVVEKAKTLERLKAKAARVAALKGAAPPGSNG